MCDVYKSLGIKIPKIEFPSCPECGFMLKELISSSCPKCRQNIDSNWWETTARQAYDSMSDQMAKFACPSCGEDFLLTGDNVSPLGNIDCPHCLSRDFDVSCPHCLGFHHSEEIGFYLCGGFNAEYQNCS